MSGSHIDRRSFLKLSAIAGVAATSAGALQGASAGDRGRVPGASFRWNEATMADLRAAMESGETTALGLTRDYIGRIEAMDWSGPKVNSIIELNPDAEAIAASLDRERADGHVRGPLHGIPILFKDNFATADRMETTAGSLALLGSKVPRDAGAVKSLREAGAIIFGKANMSEWNSFRGWPNRGGWSARAGSGVNPYALGYTTGISSSGSAAAVAASFAAGSIGMETYGSIVMPSSLCGVVGLKPTLGLTSRSGMIGIAHSRDVSGPIGRTVADVATLLGGLVGVDPLDPFTAKSARHLHRDYRKFLDPDGLRGARIGIWRGFKNFDHGEEANRVVERHVRRLADMGATVIDPADIPHPADAIGHHIGVMLTEFKHDLKAYLSQLTNTDIRTLSDVIAFNERHAGEELRWHDQGLLEWGNEALPLSDPVYRKDLRLSRKLAREGFAAVMDRHHLDALFTATFIPAWANDLLNGDPPDQGASGPSNAAGYPHITVPAGYVGELPIGVSFLARAWEEPKLLRYAYAFEQAVQARHAPKFLKDYGLRDFVSR